MTQKKIHSIFALVLVIVGTTTLFVLPHAITGYADDNSKTDQNVVITLSVDKTNYTLDEYVEISGTVSKKIFIEKPYFQVSVVKITITGQNYHKEISLHPDLNLNFKTSLGLKQVYGITEGAYVVTVEYAGITEQTQFYVGNEIVNIKKDTQSELSISFGQESYIPGQTAMIFGKTTEIIPFEGLKFKVYNPNKVQIFDGTLYPDSNGEFSTSIFMTLINPVFGIHVIKAEYSLQSATNSFTLTKELIDDKPISLSSDKSVYGLDEIVKITGRLNDIWLFSMDLDIQQIDSPLINFDSFLLLNEQNTVRIEGDGTFEYEFVIGNSPNRYGEYKVRVYENVGETKIFFNVVENPDIYKDIESPPLSVYADKKIYEESDKISVSGKVNVDLVGVSNTNTVNIQIVRSDAYLDKSIVLITHDNIPVSYRLNAILDATGNYMIKDTLYASVYKPGNYTILATYANGAYKAVDTFTIIDHFDFEGVFKLDINKKVYGLGETVVVNGILSNAAQGNGVTIILYKPNGDTDTFGALPDESKFSWSWKIPIEEKPRVVFNERNVITSNYGVYQIVFSTDSERSNLFFKVSPNPESDSLNVAPLEITTNKPVYNAGETVTISGVAQKKSYNTQGLVIEERVKIIIKETIAPFTEIYDAFLDLDIGGRFESSFNLPITIFKEGTYEIVATYNNTQTETIFSVNNKLVYGINDPLSLILKADKNEYYLGDTVHITGRLNKIVYFETVDVTIIKENSTQIICDVSCDSSTNTETISANALGEFTYDFPIVSTADAKGTYRATFDTEFGVFDLTFTVTDAPEQKPSIKLAARVIEKFNRITESDIQINVTEKTQDQSQLLPRIIQGSLFTPARDETTSVSINVMSESGVCVIGMSNGCLVSESTRGPGTIYKVVDIDGIKYNIRYSGNDVRLEKFTILPESTDTIIPESIWNVKIIKNEQPTRFYYKIIYINPE